MRRRSLLNSISTSKFIDLGLPSGTLWANGNLCKDGQGNYYIGEETDYGTHVSWANIDGHNPEEQYVFNQNTYNSTSGNLLTTDIQPYDLSYDICTKRLGNQYRLPTYNEFLELIGNTSKQWQDNYKGTGVSGYKFMKKDDESIYIFLPKIYNASHGCYWSTKREGSLRAIHLYFTSSSCRTMNWEKYNGFPIRAVYKP